MRVPVEIIELEKVEYEINQIADGYEEYLNLKHYVVITQNFNIDIITEWEPNVEILQKQ